MKVYILPLWESGKLVPRWRIGQIRRHKGDLVISEDRDEHLNRTMRAARLCDHEGNDVITPLSDAAVLWMRGTQMTITGLERCDVYPTYAQTWFIEVLAFDDFD